MRNKLLYLICVMILIVACNKKIGCPNDFYNNFDKKKTTTKNMNSKKAPKKKGSSSDKMGPQ